MRTMCQACCAERTTPHNGFYCKICHLPLCQECEKGVNSSNLNGKYQDRCCKSCSEKYESLRPDGMNLHNTTVISPTPSLSSYGSFSNYGDIPADLSSQIRVDVVDVLDTGQNNPNLEFAEHLEDHENGNFVNNIGNQYSYSRTSSVGDNPSQSSKLETHGDNHSPLGDGQISVPGDDSDGSENAMDSSSTSFFSKIETDMLIWTPPEPEDFEDEMESVANNDDDDDYSDGTKWGQPSSLSGLNEEHGKSHEFKEERQKVMLEAMNGQFKILVSRFLVSEGMDVQSWLNIVASLSWEAALLVKPDASEGRAMDPGSYVKVKCIGTGARSESEVIKGLVFKKNTAHKHMPTKLKNPRLLLLHGALGHSAVSLSSFNSMEEEKDHLKSIIEMIETCHPNLVLVEKSVSRDIQESLLGKGMTLVYDMKLPRLERIARCTGSQIISSADILMRPKLRQCDSFRIEKIVEEHNISGESGKRPTKTLMFLEGCPKPLGCTILLKGAHSDELKKVKHMMHYTIFAAYHLILETSFFADQRAICTAIEGYETSIDKPELVGNYVATPDSISSDPDGSKAGDTPENALDIPISDGSQEKSHQFNDELNSYEVHGQLLSSVSDSLIKFMGDSITPLTTKSISSYISFKEKDSIGQTVDVPVSFSLVPLDHEASNLGSVEKQDDGNHKGVSDKFRMPTKDEIESVLDPQSILVLFSSQCITKQIECEQSHLSRIKYYGNFDMSLGRFLHDNLFNQKHSCSSCGEPPESHVYRYTHQNGNLTVLVRRIPVKSILPGEAEGKIWMWTRCLKCDRHGGIPRSTRRVVMSSAARGLSFGKFLELSFSIHSATSRLSRCGHSLHRDSLRFFGLGSKVAMFRYSAVEIYAVCKPPPVMEFHSPNAQEWFQKEANFVHAKGDVFFREVANILQKFKPRFSTSLCEKLFNNSSSIKEFSQVEQMLVQEKTEFEACLMRAIGQYSQSGRSGYEILGFNWLKQDLLLELYIWDRRLHSIFMCLRDDDTSNYASNEDSHKENEKETVKENGDSVSEGPTQNPDDSMESLASDSNQEHSITITEIGPKITLDEISGDSIDNSHHSFNVLGEENSTPSISDNFSDVNDKVCQKESIPVLDEMQDTIGTSKPGADSIMNCGEISAQGRHNDADKSTDSRNGKLEDPEGWIWAPFSELRFVFRKDLVGGTLQKFKFINGYAPTYLSSIHQLIDHETDALHFLVGPGGNVISVCNDDISSLIACALALSEDQYGLTSDTVDLEGEVKGEVIQTSNGSLASSYWSSTGSLDSECTRSSHSISFSSDELFASSLDGSLFVDRLIASEDLHPEIPVGSEKISGKNKYSVICIHAKQFYSLRRRCCPSELAYISSLSRSKKWDAQGGKSKAFFARSLDERLIIKQIKKTELDSFLKFAPDYFKHISGSLDSGSQTCLAKILGIYQVRQNRNGKEVKTDIMVMENLLFGRNVSRTYDLKGAVFSRYVSDSNDPVKVLLDQNFVEDMRISPIYIGGRTKQLLQRAIWNDTSFLTSINVMDYSLLVGVDKNRHELIFGIIDYLRQYTWDKQLETWVKASLVVPKNSLPTVVSPKEYKKRFRKFMTKYFLTVPDSWMSEQCSGSCRTCTGGCNSSSKLHSTPPQEIEEGSVL